MTSVKTQSSPPLLCIKRLICLVNAQPRIAGNSDPKNRWQSIPVGTARFKVDWLFTGFKLEMNR